MNPKLATLHARLRAHAPLVIAYSGGVDSAYLLAEAHRVLGEASRRLMRVPVHGRVGVRIREPEVGRGVDDHHLDSGAGAGRQQLVDEAG